MRRRLRRSGQRRCERRRGETKGHKGLLCDERIELLDFWRHSGAPPPGRAGTTGQLGLRLLESEKVKPWYREHVRNITVALPDEVYRQARIKAAERDTSVSALVREFLLSLGGEESDFERRRRLQEEVLGSIGGFRAGDRLSRDLAHERDELR